MVKRERTKGQTMIYKALQRLRGTKRDWKQVPRKGECSSFLFCVRRLLILFFLWMTALRKMIVLFRF